MFLSIEVLIGSSEILSDKLVAIFMGRATAEREDLVKFVASVTVGGENSTMGNGCSLLAPAKTEERLKDKCLLTIGEGEVKSINNGGDLGDDLGDHSDQRQKIRRRDCCNCCSCPIEWGDDCFLTCQR